MSEDVTIHKDHGSIMQTLTIAALVVALGAMAFVQVNMKHEQERTNRAIADLSEKEQARVDAMEQRTSTLEQDTAALHALGADANSTIKATQRRLSVTADATNKKIASEIAQTRQDTDKAITDLSQQQEAKLGDINGQVTSVKGNLDETKASLNGVSAKLDRTVGDLGEQSGLVARNHDELQALKRQGERDYAEFDLKKTKDFTRVSDLALRLTKTDAGHQKYTVAVKVADKLLEKRDKTALEPVQLYLPGGHKLVEIVVWDVNKDHITGYVSMPKS
jgi:septal ring factor EnvC (AmiA/AmiB activator)